MLYAGDTWLNNFRNIYKANSSLFHRPILLLYDCDTSKSKEQIEQLRVQAIPHNAENTKVENGIENLFPVGLFKDCFYEERSRPDGGYTTYLAKDKLCNWICEKRKNADDFAKFDRIVEILEEFMEVYQSQQVQ